MQFIKFHIKNFKSIEDVTVDLEPSGSNVFTLIGLNESGKTTILEALSSFSIVKEETGVLYSNSAIQINPTSYVPKSLKSNFTGNITVTAFVKFADGEKAKLAESVEKESGAKVNLASIPDTIEITRGHKFVNSDHTGTIFLLKVQLKAVPKGARKERDVSSEDDVWSVFVNKIKELIPQIIYFPTFLFNQPEKIILNPTGEEKAINRLYRQLISNIAASLQRPLDVQQHIVNRILGDENLPEKVLAFWMLAPDKQQQIEASLNEMSAHVTETVFSSWKKIFGGDFSGRQIVLKTGIDLDQDKNRHVYLQFSIKDGKSSYDITERSLGFRWFFSFLLFTFYRVSRSGEKPVFFLLDEPASNLHAKAQMQLLDSFPRIAVGSNQVMYSTHSHYLINPEWLDQAFIVSNKAIDYENVDESAILNRSNQTLVTIERYRAFVGKNPDKVTYFQPVLDKLDIVPSKLDLAKPSVLMEGKGDYLLVEYGRKVLLDSSSSVCIVPTRGATGMDELIGLFLGWGVPFVICLDDDKAGKDAKQAYLNEWGLAPDKVWTLVDVSPDLAGKEIFGFLEAADIQTIKKHFSLTKEPTKSQKQLFFSEHLAKKQKVTLSKDFLDKIQIFEGKISKAFK